MSRILDRRPTMRAALAPRLEHETATVSAPPDRAVGALQRRRGMTSLSADGMPARHLRVATNGLHLHVAVAGDGDAVLLLHGFPEHW